MWPLLVLQFHFKVLMFHTGGDGSVSLFQHPILVQSGCSFFSLKDISYTFQDHVSICKCGQYWSCNVISSFWYFLQQGMGECIIISAPNSGPILVFFFSPERDFLYLPGPCFNMQMWPVLVLQCHFKCLMFHSTSDGVYHYFNTHFWLNFGDLFFSESVNLYLSGPFSNVSLWPALTL